MPCKMCHSPRTNQSSCPLNPNACSINVKKHFKATEMTGGDPSSFITIFLDEESEMPPDLTKVLRQFTTSCVYKEQTKALVRKDAFSALEQGTDGVAPLSYIALSRLFPESDDVYNATERLFIISMTDDGTVNGFIGGILDATPIIDHRRLSFYDSVKYNTVFEEFGDVKKQKIPVSWVEIICVAPTSRGKGLSKALIQAFERLCLAKYQKERSELEYAFIGIDISGTEKGGINLGLKTLYQNLGFDFGTKTNLNVAEFRGAQFGSKWYKINPKD
jgi:GNAT superfamily N-acetyltransferase